MDVRTVAGEGIAGWLVRGLGRAAVHDGDLVAAELRRADDPVTDEAGSPEHKQAHATITARFRGLAGRDLPTAAAAGSFPVSRPRNRLRVAARLSASGRRTCS